ncbi:hypothetical protein GUITHDRAFT_161241 [Guillardia theta CCMP2712]|uniref:Uncharacterized protein n=1 Tax=Guillardia theta (strain CCMP2712) TaxID=905079 RepID=L1JW79_GUITC|nr:hypothetical protein GUITHDRAFT_161241 [Guillardia theta CCMP2712]EKX52632.1 hypothetical protein GUITHDRAFT_161241 [Guillardia theta CCMP2712]|eukprot:XP_005839612.1 hypothetical protein GUITHDRAFT_161241 [Guillardia theta CCMP2712]
MQVAGIACSVILFVAVAYYAPRQLNLTEEKPDELLTDSVSIANKILKDSKFKHASRSEKEKTVQSLLAKGSEHASGKKVVSKVAKIVANNHLTYHQRMMAMKRLLDMHTDSLQSSKHPHAALSHKAAAPHPHKVVAHHAQASKEKQHAIKKVVHHATASHAADKPTASDKVSKFAKLVKWAEAHGLPKKLANNPKDRKKVKDIIARMKADAMVESIQKQFKSDDANVEDIVHGADSSAAGVV